MTNETESSKYIVEVSTFCASSSDSWKIATTAYLLVLLLVSTAIATQNRSIREEFDKTRYSAVMIYSHFMFTILKLIIFLVSGSLGRTHVAPSIMSILLSLDTLITIGIYFLPKLIATRNDENSTYILRRNHGQRQLLDRRSLGQRQLSDERSSLEDTDPADSFSWRLVNIEDDSEK